MVVTIQDILRFDVVFHDSLYKPHFIKEHTEDPQKVMVCSQSLRELGTGWN